MHGGPSYYLATLDPVAGGDLTALVLEQGGKVHDTGFLGIYGTHPADYLAIRLATEAKADLLRRTDRFVDTRRGARASQEAHSTMARIIEALGGAPLAFVELHLFSGSESQRLAISFVEAFTHRWSPWVLEACFTPDVAEAGKNVWTMDEVRALARTQHRLPTVRGDIANWFEFLLLKYRAEQAAEAEGVAE
jgi:hypothetical protein